MSRKSTARRNERKRIAGKADAHPPLRNPPCSECGRHSHLTTGQTIYPHRHDLWSLRFWLCDCGAYVGCHKGGTGEDALGYPAGPALRKARGHVHEVLDPVWMHAETIAEYQPFDGNPWHVRGQARKRVYAYLRINLGLTVDEAHIAKLNIEQCRQAWRLFNGMSYSFIRRWWKEAGEALDAKHP